MSPNVITLNKLPVFQKLGIQGAGSNGFPSTLVMHLAATATSGAWGTAALRKMCCSDKMAMWNCVGMQGATLLSTLLDGPIYMSSITVGGQAGGLASHGAPARAVCCRMGRQGQEGEGANLQVGRQGGGRPRAWVCARPHTG